MNLYTSRIDCEVAGHWRVAGEPFALTDAQAKELTKPFGSVVSLYVPVVPAETPTVIIEEQEKAVTNGGFSRNKRRNRKAAH